MSKFKTKFNSSDYDSISNLAEDVVEQDTNFIPEYTTRIVPETMYQLEDLVETSTEIEEIHPQDENIVSNHSEEENIQNENITEELEEELKEPVNDIFLTEEAQENYDMKSNSLYVEENLVDNEIIEDKENILESDKKEEFIKMEQKEMNYETISIIIQILDLFRSYNESIQKGIKKFVSIEKSENDDSKVILGIINIEETIIQAIYDLIELKELNRPDRAFTLVDLSDNRLIKINEYVSLFNGNFKQEYSIDNKIKFCKKLELGIEDMEDTNMEFLKPLKELFKIFH